MIVSGIMAMIIGGILLIVGYIMISAVVSAVATGNAVGVVNSSFNASFWATVAIVSQAFDIGGVALIIVGIAMIVYTLFSITGGGSARR
jgi:hypothetical protein